MLGEGGRGGGSEGPLTPCWCFILQLIIVGYFVFVLLIFFKQMQHSQISCYILKIHAACWFVQAACWMMIALCCMLIDSCCMLIFQAAYWMMIALCCMLIDSCCMLICSGCMLNDDCFMLHGDWFMLHGDWFMLHADWFLLHADWFMLHAACYFFMPLNLFLNGWKKSYYHPTNVFKKWIAI